ncbi:hypothetical protein [Paenibacillus fonticola]|uniref:hypothetical protein n=1 Tax=Paenibacillus fonticola TaxID=379896 RepID=UPI00037533BE|nr:hypothetical protein [Paenibacillus fonticola]
MLKVNHLMKYFSYLLFIAIFYYCGTALLEEHSRQALKTYNYNYVYITFITIVFFGGIGAILGLSNVKVSDSRNRTLRIDKSRLLVIGLPSFIIAMTHIWAQLGLFEGYAYVYMYILSNDFILVLSSVILGHTLISSLRVDDGDLENIQKADVQKDTEFEITIR